MAGIILKKKMTVRAPIVVKVMLDGGKAHETTGEVEFKRYTSSEYEALIEQAKKDGIKPIDSMFEQCKTWSGDAFTDDEGVPIEFNKDNFYALCDWPEYLGAIMAAFSRLNLGIVQDLDSTEKN